MNVQCDLIRVICGRLVGHDDLVIGEEYATSPQLGQRVSGLVCDLVLLVWDQVWSLY